MLSQEFSHIPSLPHHAHVSERAKLLVFVIVTDFRGLYGIYKDESQGRAAPEGRDAYKRHTNQGNGL